MIWFYNNEDLLYIGSSKNMYKRCGEHLTMLKNNKHYNNKLQNYANKYGIENFRFCVHCVKDNIELSELRKLESKEIKFYDTFKNGFNLTENTICPNHIPTKEEKLKLSIKAKIRQSSPEVKERLRLQNSGTSNPNSKLSLDQIKSIRISLIGNKELSLLYKVSIKTIARVKQYKTYR